MFHRVLANRSSVNIFQQAERIEHMNKIDIGMSPFQPPLEQGRNRPGESFHPTAFDEGEDVVATFQVVHHHLS